MRGKGIHSKSIFVQLIVFSLLTSLVPILIISIFLFYKLDNTAQTETKDYHEQITSQYMKNIGEKLQQYRNSLEVIANNTVILNTLTDEKLNPYDRGELVSKEVDNSLLLEMQSEVRNCMVYSRVQNCKVYGSRASMMQQASREVWYLQEKAEEDGWFSYFALKDSEPILSLVKDIEQLDTEHLSRSQLGIIKLDVAMKRLFVPASTEGDESATYNVIVYKGQGKDAKILYQTVNNNGDEILKKYWEETADQKDGANSNGQISTYTVNGQTLEEYGLNLLFLFDNQDSWQKRVEIIEAILPLLLLLIVTVTGLIYWYSKDFSSRVELLVRKFRRAETGDLSVSEEIGGSDEIAVLDQQFNRMLGKLDQLIKTSYVQKLENKEAQLKNLQLQINPHFLYNTLDSIMWMIESERYEDAVSMVQALGRLLRISLSRGKNVISVGDELQHARSYLAIQKYRYKNKFTSYFEVEPDIEQYKTIKLVIQPLIENAIYYGMEYMDGEGEIHIRAYTREQDLYLEVEDNGPGMPEEQVEHLLTGGEKARQKGSGIGLKNVNQRIQLYFGTQYGLEIESEPDEGTVVRIHIPKTTEEEAGE